MTDRPILTTAGVLAVGWGLAVVFAPELASLLRTDYLFVKLVGVLALVQALRVVQGRRYADVEQRETPDPETSMTFATPGTEFDRRVEKAHSGSRKSRFEARKRIRSDLETAVLETIAQQEGCSTDEARAKVETGEWTDDADAAHFVGGPNPPRRSWREWLRRSLGGRTSFQSRASRTADAVARYVEDDR